MDDKKRAENNDLDELRRLLMGAELDELDELRDRLESPDKFSSEVGDILPQAMAKSAMQGGKLSEAMVPTVEEILRLSIKRDINKFADALFPVIGPAIRKSIRETLRQMLQSMNQTLEHGLSWRGLKWRLESARTGIPFAQIALLHGLVYRVEQVFLIHRETGLLLCHLGLDGVPSQNPDLVSSMLSAINDFVGDSFEIEAERSLDRIEVGDISIWLEVGPDAILAVAIRGEAPNALRTSLQQTLEQVQAELGSELTAFDGDTAVFEDRGDLLQACLQAQYREKSGGLSAKTILIVLLLLAALMYWLGHSLYQAQLRGEYLSSLGNEPGLVVTDSFFEDGVFVVRGLRDPLARDPADLIAKTALDAAGVAHRFAAYQSLEPAIVEQRVRAILAPPAEVVFEFRDKRLVVSGSADLEWRQMLRARLPLIAGLEGFDDSALRTLFAPAMLEPPPSVEMQLEDGVLYVSGSAGQEWISTLAAVPASYPEIASIDTRALVNQTEAQLVDDIARLEQQAVFFEAATAYDSDSIDAGALAKLCRKIIELADKLSRSVLIVVKGYSDSVGSFEHNLSLSRERAGFVAQAIIAGGVTPDNVVVEGLEQPVPPEASEAERRYNRRVGFEVIVE